MEQESFLLKVESNMRDSGWRDKKMEEENTTIHQWVFIMRDNGFQENVMAMDTWRLISKVFTKGYFQETIVLAMEHKSLQTEIYIRDNMKKVSSMEKASTFGHLGLATKALLLRERRKDRENGDRRLEKSILETIIRTKSKDLEDIDGRTDVFIKVNS